MQAPEGDEVSLYPHGFDWRKVAASEYLVKDLDASLSFHEIVVATKLKRFDLKRDCVCHREDRFNFKYIVMGINIFLMFALATNNDLIASLILELLDFQHFAILSVFLPYYKRLELSEQRRCLIQRICTNKYNIKRIQECLASPLSDSQLYIEYLSLQPFHKNYLIDVVEFTDQEIVYASFNPIFNIIALYTANSTLFIYKYDTFHKEKIRKVLYFEKILLCYGRILSWSGNGKYLYLGTFHLKNKNQFQLRFYYYNRYCETFSPIKDDFILEDVPGYCMNNNLWLSEKSFFYHAEDGSDTSSFEYTFDNDDDYPSKTVLAANPLFEKNDPLEKIAIFKRFIFLVYTHCPLEHYYAQARHKPHFLILQYNVDDSDAHPFRYTVVGTFLDLAVNEQMVAVLSTFTSHYYYHHHETTEKEPYSERCRLYYETRPFGESDDDDDDNDDDEIRKKSELRVTMINADFQISAVSKSTR